MRNAPSSLLSSSSVSAPLKQCGRISSSTLINMQKCKSRGDQATAPWGYFPGVGVYCQGGFRGWLYWQTLGNVVTGQSGPWGGSHPAPCSPLVPSWLPAHFRGGGGVFTWGGGQISLLRDLGLRTQELGLRVAPGIRAFALAGPLPTPPHPPAGSLLAYVSPPWDPLVSLR